MSSLLAFRRGWAFALLAILSASAAPAWAECTARPQARISPANQSSFPETLDGVPTVITLDGSASTPAAGNPNQAAITKWELIGTPPAGFVLNNPNGYVASFAAPEVTAAGLSLTFKFTITCGDRFESAQTIVNITDVLVNLPPVADLSITPSPAFEGETVTLDATGSFDPDLTPITSYAITQVGGPTVALSGNPGDAVRTFVAPNLTATTTLTFQVVVTSSGGSDSEQKIVNIQYTNDFPIASLACPPGGILAVEEGDPIQFDGSASTDPDGQILFYEWSQDTGPPTIGIESETGPTVNLVAPSLGLHELGGSTITLKVTDDGGASDTAECGLMILDATPPVLTLPADETYEADGPSGKQVFFDATAQDAVDDEDPYPATCVPPSGSFFALAPAPTKALITTVTCNAADAAGNPAEDSFTITVQDTTGPVITVPGDTGFNAVDANGAVGTYDASMTDVVDGPGTPTCTPASGSLFPLGDTTVTCTGSDLRNNAATPASFVISVIDATPPELTVPTAPIVVEATSPAGASVPFIVSATDNVDANPEVVCKVGSNVVQSGDVFALGTHAVACTATDDAGNSASGGFDITVQDTTAPNLTVPGDITEEATSPDGATATFVASATDLVDTDVTIACVPPSGSTFALGNTTVNCTATDDSGNSSNGSFNVLVRDTTDPNLHLPANIVEEATSGAGAAVSFTVTADDIVDTSVAIVCVPPSGSTFAITTTTVNCTATDDSGNDATGSFTVKVQDTTAPTVAAHADIEVNATSNSTAIVTYTNPGATDIVDGAMSTTCTPPSGSVFGMPPTTVTCSATDQAGNTGSTSFTVSLKYAFAGFYRPIDNLPTANVVQAGQAIPVKFSLGGNQGLSIFATGYPKVVAISCAANVALDDIEETVTAGNSALTYDPGTGQYIYVWKTEKSWSGTCRQLQVTFRDGTTQKANFTFKK